MVGAHAMLEKKTSRLQEQPTVGQIEMRPTVEIGYFRKRIL
jgi:hypothetical protein